MNQKCQPYLFNISGPYAVGKDSILNEILNRYGNRVHRVSTLTTRPVSPEDDPTYTQLIHEDFSQRIENGRWIANYQLSGTTAYATSVDEIENAARAGLVCIHSVYAGPHGAGRMREIFGQRLVSVGLLAEQGDVSKQLATLRARLLARDRDDPGAIEARLQHQVEPLEYVLANKQVVTPDGMQKVFNQTIINEDLERTIALIIQLFESSFF